MLQRNNLTLVNPQTGHLAFKLSHFDNDNPFDHIQRMSYYALIWVKKGNGTLKSDFSEDTFSENTLFSFSLYQPFMLNANEPLSGIAIYFHPDFFCIHKHHKEVACNGVLFNNIYSPPIVEVSEAAKSNFEMIIEQIKTKPKKFY